MNPVIVSLFVFFVPVVVFLYAPILYLSLRALDSFSPETLSLVPWNVIAFTYLQASVSAILSLVLGLLIALFVSENSFWGKRAISIFCEIVFFIPSILVVLSLLGTWGVQGWLGRTFGIVNFLGWNGILTGHVFLNFSLVYSNLLQALKELDRTEEKVALSLGASRWQVFREITLVKLKSAILQSLLLCFFYCSSSFIIVLMLGGAPRFSSLETAIYQAVKIDLDISLAILLAAIQLVVCLFLQFLRKPKRGILMSSQGMERQTLFDLRSQRVRILATFIVWVVILGLVFLPLTHLVISGFSGVFKLDWWEFSSVLIRSIVLSFIVGCVATFLSLCGSYCVQHLNNSFLKQAVYFTTSLPIALSTMVTGLAIIVTFAKTDWFRNQMFGVVCIQALSILPLGFRILNEQFTKIELEIYQTAQSLGATQWQQLTCIEFPLLRRAISLVLVTGVGISLGESSSLLLFESQGRSTITLLLFKMMGKYRFEEAFTVGLILLILTASIFWIREKWLNLN